MSQLESQTVGERERGVSGVGPTGERDPIEPVDARRPGEERPQSERQSHSVGR
jgi:hypothetical protein